MSMDHHVISAKSIKQLCQRFGYALSTNAFGLLDEKVKERIGKGAEMKSVNEWLVGVLEKFSGVGVGGRVVKKGDIERIITEISRDEDENDKYIVAVTENAIMDDKVSDNSCDNISCDISCDKIDHTPIDTLSDTRNVTTTAVEIVQLPSKGQVDEIEELKDEVERLKKIIQIILNKQAELV